MLSIKRLLAYWLDFMILAIILIGLQLVLYIISAGVPFDYLTKGYEIELWVLLTMSLPVWLYFITFDLSKRRTIGKRMLSLIVTDKNGGTINFRQALVRTFIKLLPWELTHMIILVPDPWWDVAEPQNEFLIWIPNMIMVFYIVILFLNKGSAGAHDFIAKTKVTEVSQANLSDV